MIEENPGKVPSSNLPREHTSIRRSTLPLAHLIPKRIEGRLYVPKQTSRSDTSMILSIVIKVIACPIQNTYLPSSINFLNFVQNKICYCACQHILLRQAPCSHLDSRQNYACNSKSRVWLFPHFSINFLDKKSLFLKRKFSKWNLRPHTWRVYPHNALCCQFSSFL